MRKQSESLLKGLTLAQRFMLASLFILLAGMLGIGAWVGKQIEIGVLHRTAGTTALYVDSIVSPHLQELAHTDSLSSEHITAIDTMVKDTSLGNTILTLKVWNKQGQILYSNDKRLIGRAFAVQDDLRQALGGWVAAQISDLNDEENVYERESAGGKPLLEIYTPVRLQGTKDVIAVVELYQHLDELENEIAMAQRQSWLVVGVAMVMMYLLLASFVQRASNTIVRQQHELGTQVVRLTELLQQNVLLHERVQRAAARTTALNERILRRISAEFHDGPAQDLGLALLRLDTVVARAEHCPVDLLNGCADAHDLEAVKRSINHALQEVRAISMGMGLPQLNPLTIAETLQRAIRTHERRTTTHVKLQLDQVPEQAPLPIKITLYRVVQEALSNAYRHADGIDQQVCLRYSPGELLLEVSDNGPGFDLTSDAHWDEHLGLAVMRERVESLGGIFHVQSQAGQGTQVIAQLPLAASKAVVEG